MKQTYLGFFSGRHLSLYTTTILYGPDPDLVIHQITIRTALGTRERFHSFVPSTSSPDILDHSFSKTLYRYGESSKDYYRTTSAVSPRSFEIPPASWVLYHLHQATLTRPNRSPTSIDCAPLGLYWRTIVYSIQLHPGSTIGIPPLSTTPNKACRFSYWVLGRSSGFFHSLQTTNPSSTQPLKTWTLPAQREPFTIYITYQAWRALRRRFPDRQRLSSSRHFGS